MGGGHSKINTRIKAGKVRGTVAGPLEVADDLDDDVTVTVTTARKLKMEGRVAELTKARHQAIGETLDEIDEVLTSIKDLGVDHTLILSRRLRERARLAIQESDLLIEKMEQRLNR